MTNGKLNTEKTANSDLGAVITRYSFQEIEKILYGYIDSIIGCVNDSQGAIDPSKYIADMETTLKVLRQVYNV